MSPITTHILDIASGRPASEVAVGLERYEEGTWISIGRGTTNADGRCADLMKPGTLSRGVYRIEFDTGGYFESHSQTTFYPEVKIVFEVVSEAEHYHVPLLLSPYGYSTYRGS